MVEIDTSKKFILKNGDSETEMTLDRFNDEGYYIQDFVVVEPTKNNVIGVIKDYVYVRQFMTSEEVRVATNKKNKPWWY